MEQDKLNTLGWRVIMAVREEFKDVGRSGDLGFDSENGEGYLERIGMNGFDMDFQIIPHGKEERA